MGILKVLYKTGVVLLAPILVLGVYSNFKSGDLVLPEIFLLIFIALLVVFAKLLLFRKNR